MPSTVSPSQHLREVRTVIIPMTDAQRDHAVASGPVAHGDGTRIRNGGGMAVSPHEGAGKAGDGKP